MAHLNTAPLLTICIPTYNRAAKLERCLDFLFLQIQEYQDKVEIFISDNASTDGTRNVILAFVEKGLDINFVTNEVNIGPDRNIAQCYLKGTGKYVLVIGDDDVLLPGAIKYILGVLSKNVWGIVFLNFYQFKKSPVDEKPYQKNTNSYVYRKGSILKRITSDVSFISANIINKDYLSEDDIIRTTGTNLNQVPGVLNAAIKSENNLFINQYYLAQQIENTTSYKYFTVFGKNFPSIVYDILGDESKEAGWIIGDIIKKSLSYHTVQLRKGKFSRLLETDNDPLSIIELYLKNYLSFWLIIYPLFKLPLFLIDAYYFLIKIYNKIYYLINQRHSGEKYQTNLN